MPKSKKTKNKHTDFQKVKIKVGRKVSKGQNETIATFKTKSIELRSVNAPKEGEVVTRKNQSLQVNYLF